jgi:hypothetical protein
LVAIQIDVSFSVIKENEIVPSAIHFCEAQHAIRLAHVPPQRELDAIGDGFQSSFSIPCRCEIMFRCLLIRR